ncbi:plantaricin C family lantibiotic [Rothia dentocariosa]
MHQDVTLLEELAEQDLTQANGGTVSVAATLAYHAYSHYTGNKGILCTVTKECNGDC